MTTPHKKIIKRTITYITLTIANFLEIIVAQPTEKTFMKDIREKLT